MNIFSLNKRSVGIILFFALFIIVICFSLFSIANPQYNIVATQTRAELTKVSYTLTSSYTQTQAALPTNTPTFTPSPVPTMTQVPTATPILSACEVRTTTTTDLFSAPSLGGKVLKTITPNEIVQVKGETEGFDWYLVSVDNIVGWVNIADNNFEFDNCQITTADLAFLIGANNFVFSETFYGKYRWVDENNQPIQILKQNLLFNAEGAQQKQAFIREQPFEWLETFNLYTSYVWGPNYDYAGVRFWDDEENYYEIRINNSCQIELIDSGVSIESPRDIDNPLALCYSDKINYLHMWVDEQRYLRVQINESEPVLFSLPAVYQGNGIKFVAQNASINIQFVIISR